MSYFKLNSFSVSDLRQILGNWNYKKREAEREIRKVEKEIHKRLYVKCPECKGTRFKKYESKYKKPIIDLSFTIPCPHCNYTGYVRRRNARPKKNK